jgi:hypothetical protein
MGAYEANLRHVAEPQAPSERDKAIRTTIEDYEALWFTEALREFAHYGDHDPDAQSGVAVAYASFIDKKVRDEGKSHVTLYAHTETAASTLLDALFHARDEGDVPNTIAATLEYQFATVFAHYADGDPSTPEVTDELGVVFDVDDARDSIAEQQIADAESEAMRRQEKEADRRGVTGLPETNPALERAERREQANRGGR